MEFTPSTIGTAIGAFLLLFFFVVSKVNGSSSAKRRPPGPRGWPLVGNMFELGDLPHQSIYKMKSKYGGVVWLQLGRVNTMVVLSAAAATEMFKKHDYPFCDRKSPDVMTVYDFNKWGVGFNNYGPTWRLMRRLCTIEFLVNSRLNETNYVRRRCLDNAVRWIEEDSAKSLSKGGTGEVLLTRFLFLMSFNLIGNLMLSRDLADATSEDGREFFDSMNVVLELAGTPNVADFLPFLKWIDPLGIKRTMVRDMTKTMKFVSGYVMERIRDRKAGKVRTKKDFLDALLDYEGDGKDGPDRVVEHNINILIMELFFAASETTSISIEWGFTELLRHPEAFKKVREEIDRVVGTNRKVEESDIENLPYLQAVIKESLRLHPALAFLLPRNTMEDTEYMGYLIPKGTQVLVSPWAIGRDPDTWSDPFSFKPERFLDSSIEYKGQHFELIPFGSGRRICIGFQLAHRVLHLTLATLVHTFDWEFPPGVSAESIDVEEKLGLTLRKKNSILAIPKRRILKA